MFYSSRDTLKTNECVVDIGGVSGVGRWCQHFGERTATLASTCGARAIAREFFDFHFSHVSSEQRGKWKANTKRTDMRRVDKVNLNFLPGFALIN